MAGWLNLYARLSELFVCGVSSLGLWPGPIWAGYRLNGSLKTGFTTNRFHSVSGYLENGPNRFETGQIFPKRAEKKPGFYPGKNGIFTSL